ncbi:MAG: Autophagy protein 22 [Peltula sp. TS41687]|nr:MAG: Autophagy protein 22 [Peltula sp. TS41687]
MEGARARPLRQNGPRYPGEDTRPTSQKELAGWYSYGWAAEVFVICGIGSFIPITLEQLARERGVLLSDKSTPCGPSFKTAGKKDEMAGQCVIYFLGAEINTASFAMYTFSISVLIQALLIISLSAAADHGTYRKRMLLISALVGSTATMLFLPVIPKVYLLGALFAIVANVSFGVSFVLLNSFLPLLVRYHPSVQEESFSSPSGAYSADRTADANSDFDDEERMLDSTAQLLPAQVLSGAAKDPSTTARSSSQATSRQLQLSTQISSYGIGIGYIAGVFVLFLAIGIVLLTGSNTFSLRLVLFFVGLWWISFTIPAALWLRPRPGPPLPGRISSGKQTNLASYISYSWKSLGRTIRRARQLKDVVLFLCAWFLLSDAIATVSGTAVLFAKTQLKMKPAALASINVITTVCGIIGAFTWAKISHLIGLRPHQTILACILLFELIPLYGLLGFIPSVQRLGVLGLQQPWEMYPLGAVYGFVMGGLSSYCRSLFGELIPPGSEAAFYALYAITDKGSSVFGPAVVGFITDRAGEIRPAFIFLAVLIGLPAPLMWAVDVERGRRDGEHLVREFGPSDDSPNRDLDQDERLQEEGEVFSDRSPAGRS